MVIFGRKERIRPRIVDRGLKFPFNPRLALAAPGAAVGDVDVLETPTVRLVGWDPWRVHVQRKRGACTVDLDRLTWHADNADGKEKNRADFVYRMKCHHHCGKAEKDMKKNIIKETFLSLLLS